MKAAPRVVLVAGAADAPELQVVVAPWPLVADGNGIGWIRPALSRRYASSFPSPHSAGRLIRPPPHAGALQGEELPYAAPPPVSAERHDGTLEESRAALLWLRLPRRRAP